MNSSLNIVEHIDPSLHILEKLRQDIIGKNVVFQGPFGPRMCLYLDQTASGKPLKSVESFVMENVLPIYANTHSTTSFCASQMTQLRESARQIVKESCGGSEDDVLIFCGSGSTGAIHKLVSSIFSSQDPSPVVIIGPYEHHSNILPWRVAAYKVIAIPEDNSGLLDTNFLEKVLQSLQAEKQFQNRMVIGAFSASSNVTGALTDDVEITVLMHKYGGFAFWDYSAAAPHVTIAMNPDTGEDEKRNKAAEKDAIYFSGHKFTGGPQTTGILMAKKHVFRNPVPEGGGGGGTVLFVTKQNQEYSHKIFEKEEAGTPNIIGAIRLGLVFRLKNKIGTHLVVSRENYFTKKALDAWSSIPEIVLLGSTSMTRIPIISFLIQHLQSGFYLHHDFLVAILNDLFGIQCRGGCMCAGPYSQSLLGIDDDLASKYEQILLKPRKMQDTSADADTSFNVIFKPGYVRLSLPCHASDEDINYMIESVKYVAQNGWKLLPFYKFNIASGSFRFTESGYGEVAGIKLNSFLSPGEKEAKNTVSLGAGAPCYSECLAFAEDLATATTLLANTQPNIEIQTFAPEFEPFRWFLLPSEALQYLKNCRSLKFIKKVGRCPFTPVNNFAVDKNPGIKWNPGSIPHEIKTILQYDSNQNNSLTKEEVSELFKHLRLEGKNSNHGDLDEKSNSSLTSGVFEDETFEEWKCNYCASSNVRR